MTAVRAAMFAEMGVSGVVLCGREYMNSLEESSMEEVKQAIRSLPWLNRYFDIGEKYIRTKNRRVSYVFAGLRKSLDSIKSKARILIAWIDEAESVSEAGLIKLFPTVREEGMVNGVPWNSEIWLTWNPELEGSPVDKRFRQNCPHNAIVVEMNYTDNPWFPQVLDEERLNDREVMDDATYAWVWEGAYRKNSDAQILNGKYRVMDFDRDALEGDGPYFGVDWGFSQDPTAGLKLRINDLRLYVCYEAGKVGLELDDIAGYLIDRIPGIENAVVRADNARPETISHVKSKGFPPNRRNLPRIIAANKWPGSVEDGIAHLRSYKEIIVHPECTKFLFEARRYSYKVDRLTGEVTTDIIDKHNHYIDASRYALDPLVKRKSPGGILLPNRR